MTNRAICVLITAFSAAALAITAGAQQLNPTVTVLKTATASVPSDCDQSLAPQPAPRVEVAQIPEPPNRKATAAPPTASVRAQLKDVQTAADRGDRDAFRDALARVKATLATYPAGGEKAAAGDVIRVYDDLDRVWTYQTESPTGSFFDATTVPAQIMRGYPGFERAIADQVLVGGTGTRFYPTTETREFLVREAATRLKTLGVTVAVRAPRPQRVLPRIATAPAKPRAEAKTTERKETTAERKAEVTKAKPETIVTEEKRPRHHAHVRTHRAETKVAEAREKPAAKHETKSTTEKAEAAGSMKAAKPEATHEPTVKPVVKRAPKEAPRTETKAAEKAPAATAPPTTTSSAPAETTSAAAPSTPVTTSATTATETTASAPATQTTSTAPATETTTSAAAPATETTASTASSTDTTGTAAKGQPQSKGVILPIILIVVGIGVLIVLFRASS